MTKSQYADRETVGSIVLKARQENNVIVGDLGHELMPSLVEDLNDTIASNPYEGKPFFIIIHEKKDLQLETALLRRMITSDRRPYPEPNTSVFWTNPKTQETRFCWSLPHQSLFIQYLCNPDKYEEEQIRDIKEYLAENMSHFGFKKVEKLPDGRFKCLADPNFKDRKLKQTRREKYSKTLIK